MKLHSVSIDRGSGTAYVRFATPKTGRSKRQINLHDAVILDIGSHGELIAVEILHPDLTAMLLGADSIHALEAASVPVEVA